MSGAGLLAGLRLGAAAVTLALAGAARPILHGLSWFNHGFPTTPARMATGSLGVAGLAALGLWRAVLRSKQEGTLQ